MIILLKKCIPISVILKLVSPTDQTLIHYCFSVTLRTYQPQSTLIVFYLWEKVLSASDCSFKLHQYPIGPSGGCMVTINVSKTKAIIIFWQKDILSHWLHSPLFLNNSIIENVTVHEHLGLILSPNLSLVSAYSKNSSKSFQKN